MLPSQHGALSVREPLATSFRTIAERLGERGYETFALNENPWVGNAELAITQGFDGLVNMASDFWLSPPSGGLASGDIAEELEAWLVERPADRPFFLFVNIMDAHSPYAVEATNPHLPAGTTADEARAVSQRPADHVCRTGAEAREMQILHGLYLGGVNAADRKLGRVIAALGKASKGRNLITVVASDHGEYFGERRLILHDLGVHQPVAQVPLVVHGVPGVSPAVIDTPVQLIDVLPSALAWAGAPPDNELPGRPLPTQPGTSETTRAVITEYFDPDHESTPEPLRQIVRTTREHCGPEDRVWGDARAVVRPPYQLVWYAHYPSELFDLRVPPGERSDLALASPAVVAELEQALPPRATRTVHDPTPQKLSPNLVRALRTLGYLGGPESDSSAKEARQK